MEGLRTLAHENIQRFIIECIMWNIQDVPLFSVQTLPVYCVSKNETKILITLYQEVLTKYETCI